MNRVAAEKDRLFQGPPDARVTVALRKASLQTDELTIEIARNQRTLEDFARKFELPALLSPEARATFASMTEEEFNDVLRLMQLAIRIGWRALKDRDRTIQGLTTGMSETIEQVRSMKALVAVSKDPSLLGARVWKMFQQMPPRARRAVALILIEALRAADESTRLNTRDRPRRSGVGGQRTA